MKAQGFWSKSRIVEACLIGTSFLLVGAMCLWLSLKDKSAANTADISLKGERLYSLTLDHQEEIDIPSDHGHILVDVDVGKIAVKSSPCPSQYCVHQGYKSHEGESIICAYEGLSITLRSVGGVEVIHV